MSINSIINKSPFSLYLGALVLGILCYSYTAIPIHYVLFIEVFLVFILIFIVKKSRYKTFFFFILLLIWILLGVIIKNINQHIPSNHYTHSIDKKENYLLVLLESQENSTETHKKYVGTVKQISNNNKWIFSSGKILIYLNKKNHPTDLTVNNSYLIKAKISSISPPLNPHQFNYKKYLELKYITNIAYVTTIIKNTNLNVSKYSLKTLNKKAVNDIERSSLPPNSKEFLNAFLLGDRTEMLSENITAYSNAGIMHLIAISGMHMVFIFGLVFFTLKILFGNKNRKTLIILALFSIWLYSFFVGLSPSVFRACLMLTIYYISVLLKRNANLYHSLSLSAIIILLINPNELYSIGFQLSYSAVFFIAWLSPSLVQRLKVKNKKVNKIIIEPIAITLAAQLGVLPILLFYFHQFSLLSIPFNILIIPYAVFITYFSVFELITILLLPLNIEKYSSILYAYSTEWLLDTSYWVSSLNIFMIKNISLSIFSLVTLLLLIIYLKYFLIRISLKSTILCLLFLLIFRAEQTMQDINAEKKNQFIVFHNKHPLLGLREGRSIVFLTDSCAPLNTIEKNIIQPYVSNERINNIKYKAIDYSKVYHWKLRKFMFLRDSALNYKYSDTIDYIIINNYSYSKIENIKFRKAIFINAVQTNYYKELRLSNFPNSWDIRVQGAFINSDSLNNKHLSVF